MLSLLATLVFLSSIFDAPLAALNKLSGLQKVLITAGVPVVGLVGYFGINALRNQEYKPVSTPTLKLRCFFQDFFPALQRNR